MQTVPKTDYRFPPPVLARLSQGIAGQTGTELTKISFCRKWVCTVTYCLQKI